MAPTTKSQGTSKKQLYIVIGGAVVLAILLAIQLPKLLGGGSETAAPTTTGAVPTSSETTGTPSTTGGAVSVSGSGAVLAGVKIVPGVAVEPGEGQLASFSLFQHRDPFVQLVKDTGAAGSQDGEPVAASRSRTAAEPPDRRPQRRRRRPIVSGGTPGTVAGPSRALDRDDLGQRQRRVRRRQEAVPEGRPDLRPPEPEAEGGADRSRRRRVHRRCGDHPEDGAVADSREHRDGRPLHPPSALHRLPARAGAAVLHAGHELAEE